MKPLFKLGPLTLPAYFLMFFLAAVIAAFFIYFFGRRDRLKSSVLICLILLGTLGAILGGKVAHILSDVSRYKVLLDFNAYRLIWRRGYISYGAILGAALAVAIYLKIKGEKTLKYLDLCFLAAPIAVFFVRLGCLLAGCCYGKPTELFIHLTFHDPGTPAGKLYLGIPIHATQVYGMAKAILLFCFLGWRYPRRKFLGEITILFFMFYSFLRFSIEFLRADSIRHHLWGLNLTSAQIAMVIIFLISLAGYVWLGFIKKPAKSDAHPPDILVGRPEAPRLQTP